MRHTILRQPHFVLIKKKFKATLYTTGRCWCSLTISSKEKGRSWKVGLRMRLKRIMFLCSIACYNGLCKQRGCGWGDWLDSCSVFLWKIGHSLLWLSQTWPIWVGRAGDSVCLSHIYFNGSDLCLDYPRDVTAERKSGAAGTFSAVLLRFFRVLQILSMFIRFGLYFFTNIKNISIMLHFIFRAFNIILNGLISGMLFRKCIFGSFSRNKIRW